MKSLFHSPSNGLVRNLGVWSRVNAPLDLALVNMTFSFVILRLYTKKATFNYVISQALYASVFTSLALSFNMADNSSRNGLVGFYMCLLFWRL